MESVLSLLALCMLALTLSDAVYINYYDEPARMYCPDDQYMYKIFSVHSNRHEDRRWGFECRDGGQITNCGWTDYVNDWDQPLTYTCPGNKVIQSIYSAHHNRQEDRRFKFKCCDIVGKTTGNCHFTGYVNDWDGPMSVTAGQGYAIKGATSYHSNHREDRRWNFYLCVLS